MAVSPSALDFMVRGSGMPPNPFWDKDATGFPLDFMVWASVLSLNPIMSLNPYWDNGRMPFRLGLYGVGQGYAAKPVLG